MLAGVAAFVAVDWLHRRGAAPRGAAYAAVAVVGLLWWWLERRLFDRAAWHWLVRRGRARAGACVHGDYDLTGNVSGVCPECGVAAPCRAACSGS